MSCGQKICLKKVFPIVIMGAIKALFERMHLVSLDPRCMVGRIYGTTSCGSHGFREDFLKSFSF